jgi:hypothetical protein
MRTLFTLVVFCIIGDTTFAGPPVTIRDRQGRIVATATPTVRSGTVIRDSAGRITASVVVKSGNVVIRDSSGRIGSGSLLPSKSGVSGKTGKR